MKEIANFIGGIFTLFFVGLIVYGIFKEGHTVGIIIVISIVLMIWFLVLKDFRNENEVRLRQETIIKTEREERRGIERIEKMSEQEFISFVRYNHNELSKHFKNGVVSRFGHGVESMRYQTSKYIIESTIDDTDFNKSIKIFRRFDKAKIFSGGWGYRQ